MSDEFPSHPEIALAEELHNAAEGPKSGDVTLVECPACKDCPVCTGGRMVTLERAAAWSANPCALPACAIHCPMKP
jgi:hypothetical protein